MGKRGEGHAREIKYNIDAVADNDSGDGDRLFAKREDFKSRFVKKITGVPIGLDISRAIDTWAEAWGKLQGIESSQEIEDPRREEVVSFHRSVVAVRADKFLKERHEGVVQEIAAAERVLLELFPDAIFVDGRLTFKDGYVQLSV